MPGVEQSKTNNFMAHKMNTQKRRMKAGSHGKPAKRKRRQTKNISHYFHQGSQARYQVDESNITTLHILTLNHSYAFRTGEATLRLYDHFVRQGRISSKMGIRDFSNKPELDIRG